ncbi:MAG: 2-oxo acid dehydrogenase subunit E2 [Chloroflexi bacterium]|nr:2-oxo acid dehydrogenase subunit E2 [Chloroflexota bacterium]
MSTTITMPQVGETVTEGTILKWLKRPGELVKKYESLVEVMTDKVNVEVPSPAEGVVKELIAKEGEVVPVGKPIAVLEEVGAAAPPLPVGEGRGEGPTVRPEPVEGRAPAPASAPAGEHPQFVSPVVQRLAREHGLDLSQIRGTGIGGRVSKQDVLKHLESAPAAAAPPPAAHPAQPAPPTPGAAPRPTIPHELVPLTPLRRAIAQHMLRSVQTSPMAWTMVEADVTGMVRLRQEVAAAFEAKEGIHLTYLPFAIKAVCGALHEHPRVNARWIDEGVAVLKALNISVAVDTDAGLLVPVIHGADRLSIGGLAHAVADLVARARAGKLAIQDVEGGTFTVNNTGAFGSIVSQPILNQPQAANLTTEAIVKRPVVLGDDAIAVRSMINLCLTFDHRVLDGGEVGRFLQSVKRRLEAYKPGDHI